MCWELLAGYESAFDVLGNAPFGPGERGNFLFCWKVTFEGPISGTGLARQSTCVCGCANGVGARSFAAGALLV